MIRNLDTGKYLAGYPEWAWDPFTRLRGMTFRRFVCGKFDALVFERCNSVHTCFMGYPLDLVFLDRSCHVVKVVEHLKPWRTAFGGRGAVAVIELPPGGVHFSGTEPGHLIDLKYNPGMEGNEKFSSRDVLLSEVVCRK